MGEFGYKRGNKSPKTKQYHDMLKNQPNLCKSQVYSEIYKQLENDSRLNRFIAVVQYCSLSGLSKKDSVDLIRRAFPGYLNNKNWNESIFDLMIREKKDIAIAWGYGPLGDEITQIMIKNRATELALKTQDIKELAIYNEMYKKQEQEATGSNGTVVNFNINK